MNEVEIIVKNAFIVKLYFLTSLIQEKARQNSVAFDILKFYKEFT